MADYKDTEQQRPFCLSDTVLWVAFVLDVVFVSISVFLFQ